MRFEAVLNQLNTEFAGKQVLYPKDIAKILGRSLRSIEHLIDRDRLPFNVRTIGNRRCVTLINVAEWLAQDLNVDELLPPIQDSKPANLPSKRTRHPTTPTTSRSSRASLSQDLMEMRHASALACSRLAAMLPDIDEQHFFREIAFHLAFPRKPISVGSVFRITCRSMTKNFDGVVEEEIKRNCPTIEDVRNFVSEYKKLMLEALATDVAVQFDKKIIFHAYKVHSNAWVVLNDQINLS